MNEYEAHLSSYDHSHKQRLKDMKQLQRDPMASTKARKAEAKANSQSGLISIKLGGEPAAGGGGGGFKKAGFKKAGFKSAFAPVDGEGTATEAKVEEKVRKASIGTKVLEDSTVESDTDDEGYEMYDPRYPTDWSAYLRISTLKAKRLPITLFGNTTIPPTVGGQATNWTKNALVGPAHGRLSAHTSWSTSRILPL